MADQFMKQSKFLPNTGSEGIIRNYNKTPTVITS